MPKGKMTIDGLARMVKAGFDGVINKNEFQEFWKENREDHRLFDGRLDVIESEILDIKKKLDNIIYRHEFELIKDRIAYLEKVVATKGK